MLSVPYSISEGCPSPARTCTRPKTPKRSASLPSLSRDGRLLAPVSETASATLGAATTADVNLLYETPSRKTSATAMEEVVDGRKQSGIGSARKGCASIGHEEEGCGEGLLTPLPKGGSCAICLSPLAKKQGVKQEVYTIQLCRVRAITHLPICFQCFFFSRTQVEPTTVELYTYSTTIKAYSEALPNA